MMRPIALAALLCVAAFPALAGEARCREYNRAEGQDRSLFDGYIYGYVMAKLEKRGDHEVNVATGRVKEMTTAYCHEKPEDRLSAVVATFTSVVARYKAD